MAFPAVRPTARVVRWEPLRDAAALDRQFAQVARAFFEGQPAGIRAWSPVADVTTTDEAYTVDVELPGLKRDEITIELVEDTLLVHGHYGDADAAKGEEAKPARARRTGRFEYRRALPVDVAVDGVTASLADGVLSVTLPRVAKPAARQIEITEA